MISSLWCALEIWEDQTEAKVESTILGELRTGYGTTATSIGPATKRDRYIPRLICSPETGPDEVRV